MGQEKRLVKELITACLWKSTQKSRMESTAVESTDEVTTFFIVSFKTLFPSILSFLLSCVTRLRSPIFARCGLGSAVSKVTSKTWSTDVSDVFPSYLLRLLYCVVFIEQTKLHHCFFGQCVSMHSSRFLSSRCLLGFCTEAVTSLSVPSSRTVSNFLFAVASAVCSRTDHRICL